MKANSGSSASGSTRHPPRGGRSARVSARLDEKKPANTTVRTMRPICRPASHEISTCCGGTGACSSAGLAKNTAEPIEAANPNSAAPAKMTTAGRQHRPGGPAGARHIGSRRPGGGCVDRWDCQTCGSPVRRRIPACARALAAYSMPPGGASCSYLSSPYGRGMLTGRLRRRVLDVPAHVADETGFFSGASASIFSVPDSSGYGDKRGRNKPIGPGGSTRRLHHMPVRALNATFGARASDGGELGSTKV